MYRSRDFRDAHHIASAADRIALAMTRAPNCVSEVHVLLLMVTRRTRVGVAHIDSRRTHQRCRDTDWFTDVPSDGMMQRV